MDGLKSTVADHYNNLPELGQERRKDSPIFYLRSFNNWIKSVAIKEALAALRENQRQGAPRRLRALDLCCGKGGDINKWMRGGLDKVIFADLAGTSLQQAEERYILKRSESSGRRYGPPLFRAEFISADCAAVDLTERFSDSRQQFDLVSCQFSFHYSFESYERAETMLRNACDRLVPGGIFIGTIPDAHEIMRRLKASGGLSFGNDIYSVTFDTAEQQPLFGAKYHFYLQEHVNCPEFLVFFPVLMEMAAKYDMELLYRCTFNEFFDEHSGKHEDLLRVINSLETYPSDSLVGSVERHEYDYAQYVIDNRLSPTDGVPLRVGTLSKPEWEMASLYSAFAFRKKAAAVDADNAHNSGGHRNELSGGQRDDDHDDAARNYGGSDTEKSRHGRESKRPRRE